MAPRKATKRKKPVDPLLALLDGEPTPITTDELLDLIGGNEFVEPKPAAPQGKRPTYREHLLGTKDSTSRAHVIMPIDLVDMYREYDRAPGGKDYRSEYEDVLAVIKEQGIRQPLWISTDGKTAMLVEGNNRLAVAKELGIEELPVRVTYDKKTMRNEGVDPVPLDPALGRWVRKNRIEGRYGSDAFPDKGSGVSLPKTPGNILYRGMALDFKAEGMEEARAIMHPHLSDDPKVNTLERLYKDEQDGSFSDPALGPIILDYMDSKHGGLGFHWTPDHRVANSWANSGSGNVKAVLVGEHYGGGESTFNPGWDYEKEVPLENWAEIRINEVLVQDPRDFEWNNVLGQPVERTVGSSKPDRIGFEDTSVGLDAGFPTITKPSRKSRSYLNPEHREDVLAKAGAVSIPYRNAVKDIQHRVIEYVRAAYESNPGFLTNHEDIDRLTALMAPALAAGQMQIADLTNAHLANLFGLEDPPSVDVSKYGRPGVPRETELSRPFWTAIKAAKAGKSTDEALAAGMRRMEKMLATDFQMAKVIQSRDALKAAGVQQYSRVAGPNACWLCAIAATQTYYTEDLLPIHPGCGCDVAPVPPGGQKTLDSTLDPELLLTQSSDQVKLMTEKVESGASPAELRDLVAVREHGETGPQLTWAHQKFTGPDDLPVPVSRDVLAHEAYDTVRKNGGITIDLAGHQPTEGYAYAPYKTTEFKVSEAEFTPKHIDDYVDSHFEELSQKGNHLGMWVQDGYVYLDVSKVGPPEAATFAKAQAADQLAVFDLGNFEEINLGTIDETGKYRSLGEATDLHNQYREQVARADQGRSEEGVPEVPVGTGDPESRSAAAGLEWDGPPLADPITEDDEDPYLVRSGIYDLWATEDFEEYKEDFREGARIAQREGYSGFNPDGETGFEYGKEIVAGAAAAEPTDDVLYRGIRVKPKDMPTFDVGDTVSMPLSSFSLDATEAGDHATGESGWQAGGVPGPGKEGRGIVFELEPGAKTYKMYAGNDERIGFGQFEVLGVTQYEPGGTTYVSVRQTSMIEDGIRDETGVGTAALQDKPIPEFTVVKGKPQPVEWDGPPVDEPIGHIRADWSDPQRKFNNEVESHWRDSKFDKHKDDYRRGARDVQAEGYTAITEAEMSELAALVKDEKAFFNPPAEILEPLARAGGREMAARAVHSEPTEVPVYRGMIVTEGKARELLEAAEISMPLSSFSEFEDIAAGFADADGFGWRSKDVTSDSDQGVFIQLKEGAKLADISDVEQLGFGKFKVVESHRMTYREWLDITGGTDDMTLEEKERWRAMQPEGNLPIYMTVEQVSMIEDGVRAGAGVGTAALQDKPIPEFTIIKKKPSPPTFNTIDLKTGKPDTSAERITKVQPGPIPDYGDSAAAGMQLHARHPNLQVDFSGIGDPELARSSAQALDDMLTKYPQSKLHSAEAIPRFRTPSRYAQTDLYSGGEPSETVIQYNEDFYGSRKKLEKSYAKTVDVGYHPTKGEHDAAYAITVHEFAHSLDATGSYRASSQARDVLRKEFLRLHPEYKGMTGIVEQLTVRQKYDEWLTSELSGYATRSGRGKGARLPGDLNPSEAIAEAFAHVELDPDNATDAERALHKLVVDSSKLPPRKMSGAGWQSGIDTPEKVVENKEKRRARKAAEAPRPDGVFRDEYGDKWWSLDGQTYDSRIDYENALGHKEVLEREAQITAKVGDVPLYLRDGVDAEGQKEIERTITRLQKKYPNSGLRQVTTPRPDEYVDRQDMAWTSGVGTITVNPAYFGDSEKLTAEAKRLSNGSRRFNPRLPQRHSGAEQTIIHEFGHVLDYQGLEATHKQASKALKEAFLQDNPKYKKLIKTDREAVKTAYQKWLEDGLSAYSFQGSHHGYNARLNMGEAIAEAFCDVEMNGDKASRASHVLHDLVVKNAEPEAVAAAKEKRRLERLKEIQENNRVYKKGSADTTAETPAKVVEEKEKDRGKQYLSEYQKKAKEYAKEVARQEKLRAAAAKRAEDAGQIFDPKIFGKAGKPKNFVAKDLPREDIKSIRRFGGVDLAAEIPVEKGKPRRDKKTGKLKPPPNDWNGTWKHLPPITVDLDGNIVDEVLEANLRLVMAAAEEHPWVIVAGDRWYPDYASFVRHQWEMVGKINPITGEPMTFEQAMDASGAYAINVGWNATMADTHNWMIGKPNPRDGRNAYADEASQLPASLTDGRWVRRVRDEGEARKINDFTLNGKGDLSTSTTDRVMSRLALGTDDAKFAAGLLGATNAGSYVDPKTGETVKLSGYERISQAADRVAIQMGAPNEAAGQARMWIEFFGPEAAYGLPPDDVVAEGLESINAWVRKQLDDEANVDSIPRVPSGGRYNPYRLLPSR